MPRMNDEELYSLPAVVDLPTAGRALGIGKTKAYELARAGEFPCTVLRIGGRYRVARTELLRVIGAARERPAEPLGNEPLATGHAGEVAVPANGAAQDADAALAESIEQLASVLAAVVGAVVARVLADRPSPAEVPADAPVLLTYQQACRRLGISLSTLYRLLREGEVRSVTLGTNVRRIPVADLDRYVAGLLAAESGIPDE